MAVHGYHLVCWGRGVSSTRPAWATQWVLEQLERPRKTLSQTDKQTTKAKLEEKRLLQFYRTLWPRGMQGKGRGFYNVSESTDKARDLWISECVSDKTSDRNENYFWGISEKEVFSQEAQYLFVLWGCVRVCTRVCPRVRMHAYACVI